MDYLHKPRRLLITGRSGTGKTEYFLRYIKAVSNRYARIHIFDPECEFSQRANLPIVNSQEQLEKPEHFQCFDCSELYPGDLRTALDFYADYVFDAAHRFDGQSMFCVDEMQKLTDTDAVSHELSCVIETGRRWQIDTTFVTQQINLIHNRVRNQQTEVVTFRQNDPRAIDWLVNFGFNEDQIRSLNPGEYICRTDQGLEKTGNIFSGRRAKELVRPSHQATSEDDRDVPEPTPDPNIVVDTTAQKCSVPADQAS